MSQNLNEFLLFAYELRKQDIDKNHSALLLNDNLKSKILTDIILSNYWDQVS